MELSSVNLFIMKPKTAKTYLNQIIKKFGSKNAAATMLGISPRYVYMILKKERKASPPLIKLMKMLLDKDWFAINNP